MLVIGCLPELLMEVSTDNTVKTETHSKRESVINLRLLRRAVDSDLFDARPTTRVLLDNRFLQSLPLGPRTAVSSFHAEKPWHQQVVGCLSDVVGLPVIRLSRRETRGSSMSCPRCGERLQSDKHLQRKLWCGKCRIVMDRDMVAAVNLARRGRVRFARSRPPIIEAQGRAVEAMKGNPTPTVIPEVNAPKLTHQMNS